MTLQGEHRVLPFADNSVITGDRFDSWTRLCLGDVDLIFGLLKIMGQCNGWARMTLITPRLEDPKTSGLKV